MMILYTLYGCKEAWSQAGGKANHKKKGNHKKIVYLYFAFLHKKSLEYER